MTPVVEAEVPSIPSISAYGPTGPSLKLPVTASSGARAMTLCFHSSTPLPCDSLLGYRKGHSTDFLQQTHEQIDQVLNHASGLLWISGVSRDMGDCVQRMVSNYEISLAVRQKTNPHRD